jgi:hypothetical protein
MNGGPIINYLVSASTLAPSTGAAVVSTALTVVSVVTVVESVVGVVVVAPPQAARVAIATIAITFFIFVYCFYYK